MWAIQDKVLMMLGKMWVSSDLLGKVKEEISKWPDKVVVAKVAIHNKGSEVDNMSEEEAKAKLKKYMESGDWEDGNQSHLSPQEMINKYANW